MLGGLETPALRLLLAVFSRLPYCLHHGTASVAASVCHRLAPVRGRVALENLSVAFGELDEAERRRLLRGSYYHTIRFVLEMAHLGRADRAGVDARVTDEIEGREVLDRLAASGKGFLIAGAHFGNWEWLGSWFGHHFGQFGVVYKPMHNAQTDRYLEATRRRHGMTGFSTREKIPRQMMRFVRQGGVVAILADQDARHEGIWVPFFGRLASTSPGLASMAIRLNVPILPGFGLRQPDGSLKLVLMAPILPDPQADREREEARLMGEYNRCVETMIRRAPEQYFWWHRRWKSQPKPADASRP